VKEIEDIKMPENKDEWDFSNPINFAKLVKLQLRNLAETDKSLVFSKYTKAQLITFLNAPDKNEKQLRSMSAYMYNISNYYRRLVQYYSGMLTYPYIIAPYNLDTTKKINDKLFKAQYQKVLNNMDKMNIRHEFQKISKVVFKQDIFYGFVYETNDSFMIQELDPDYCKIFGMEDGVYTFQFNNAYFDKYKTALPNFDPDFKTNYDAFKKSGKELQWSALPASKTICMKVNEEVIYPIPPFVSLLSALADIEDYKALSKASTETNNYKALSMVVQTNAEGKPTLAWEKNVEYYQQVASVVPDNIGVILTPMEITALDFQKQGIATDSTMVTNAEAAFWSEACTNSQLFGGVTTSSAALGLSAQTDEVVMFNFLRQFERWVNARLKLMSGQFKFQAIFLNVTSYNQDKVYQKYLDMGRYGLPMRNAIAATMGIPPSATINMSYLENDVLKLSEKEIPLKSSNTQSSTSSTNAGRPVEDTVSDAGDITRDTGSNEEVSVQ
jgi:hypothetical protein